jgi:hypothetical protein
MTQPKGLETRFTKSSSVAIAMTHNEFGQLVLSDKAPTLAQRENVIRCQLNDWHYEAGYVRTLVVKVTSPGEFYAAITIPNGSSQLLTYVAGNIRCRRKGDGYWLKFECFMATRSVPFTLIGCPREIFEAGAASGMESSVDDVWYLRCIESQIARDKAQYLRKGEIFELATGAPSAVLSGERAPYAVVINKAKALFVCPQTRVTREGNTDALIQHYNPVQANAVPTFVDIGAYAEAGELLFDLAGVKPILKGRLAVGAKAKLISKIRLEKDLVLAASYEKANFSDRFQTGSWFA